jgi:hypothetical protein
LVARKKISSGCNFLLLSLDAVSGKKTEAVTDVKIVVEHPHKAYFRQKIMV